MKQIQGLDRFAKIAFSKIEVFETNPIAHARVAVGYLVKNGYVCMDSYTMNEIINLIRALKEMKIEYKMVTIDRNLNNVNDKNMLYEFTLGYFEDDRK